MIGMFLRISTHYVYVTVWFKNLISLNLKINYAQIFCFLKAAIFNEQKFRKKVIYFFKQLLLLKLKV